ncbi:BTAD domain-containing putative transcriptional regulator [Mycolicibacterium brisbanense]|uniref:Transcriptional activator domain protein n=1 Tax=Mycolicibacterium brisbanense TaxID=146020 RepID=A0A117I7K5_9MYCO|nr:BTAD domain-containing putative transcriptional regulator [Mycolicibacterium brisbanense]MCV7160423.1 transcriptional activator domain protein [Mycolicibacterium brisbanense]GAS91817.1 transcriptional activator domain protein [Mycolicibacterium brisbanense]
MSAPDVERPRVIRRKIIVPETPADAAPRERLDRLLCQLVQTHRIIAIAATAGAGKSVAAAHASRTFGKPVAWLSVDATDAAPGRLLTYLEEALAQQLPSVRGVATGALAAGIPHAEAAGLLIDAAADTELVFVLDDLERLQGSPDAWEVIGSVVRYAAPSTRLILISRQPIPAEVWSPALAGAVARVDDADLAFNVDEARVALQQLGRSGSDASEAVQATGGWVIGVLFEAWRSAGHGSGGTDPEAMGAYLGAHILGELGADDREFLVSTSVLDEVSVDSAVALGIDDAARRLASLRRATIPAQWSSDPLAMRCHSRFREYLRGLLDQRGSTAVRELRAAHGRLLASNGFHEEAVEELLAVSALTDAYASARHAILPVLGRLDFAVADRWIDALAPVVPVGDDGFAEARLMLVVARDDQRDGARIADELAVLGLRDRLAAASEHAAALMAWCYLLAGRIDEMNAVLRAAPAGPDVNIVRYALALVDPEGGPARPEPTGGLLDGMLFGIDYFRGRVHELTGDAPSPWTRAAMGAGRIGALRATGRTAEALQEYETAAGGGFFRGVVDSVIAPDVLLDAGRPEEARAALARGSTFIQANGSPMLTALHQVLAAKLMLRADRDTAGATAILNQIERDAARRYAVVFEFAQTWHGLAALIRDDVDGALSSLRAAVAGMRSGGRILELPTAAVYLAEAEWRAGNPDAADRAADVALQAARRHGSNHVLLQALADFPAVVARCIDAQPDADSAWHAIGRALAAQGVAVGTRIPTAVELIEFGRTAIILDGFEVQPNLSKCYELLSFLAVRNGAPAGRDELLDALFDGRGDESARSYLRKTVIGVRRVLPPDALSVGDDGRVRLDPDVVLASESARVEHELAAAARLQGEALVVATEHALEPLAHGDYLPGISSAWVDERRDQLAELAASARAAAADAAFSVDRYDDANRLATAVLDRDPLREAMWRLLMRVRAAVGDYDGVITTFAHCERALQSAGITPAASTRTLLDRLRR